MNKDFCPKCGMEQFSLMDRKYLELSGIRETKQCWACDLKDWKAKFLSLEEFEKRENLALLGVSK